MKRIFTLVMALLLALSLMTACGGNNSNGSTTPSLSSDSNNVSDEPGEFFGADGLIDLRDNRNYFAVVNGVRYDMNTTIRNVLDDGYTVDESAIDLKEILKPGSYKGTLNFYKGKDIYFTVHPINRTNNPITQAECSIIYMYFSSSNPANVTIVCGLTIGSTLADVEKVFGVDYYSKTDTIVTYKPSNADNRAFTFMFDDSGKVKNILIQGDVAID
ncbi:MAG: hypothetical protein FWF10_07150 [Clostridiales bacterium]|nr:hypothetical protein [Clostridiales bacterium]